MLLGFGHDRPIVDEGTAGSAGRAVVDRHDGFHEVAVDVEMSDPKLGELAGAAAHRVLVAFGARAAVEPRAEPAVHIVLHFIDLLVECKIVTGWLGNSVAHAPRTGILDERGCVEARGRLGCRLLRGAGPQRHLHADPPNYNSSQSVIHVIRLLKIDSLPCPTRGESWSLRATPS